MSGLPIKVRGVVKDIRVGGDDPLVVLDVATGGEASIRIPRADLAERFAVGDAWNIYLSPALSEADIEQRTAAWHARVDAPPEVA